MEVENISPQEAYEKIIRGNAVYLDVRTQQEFQKSHAKNAYNVPVMNRVDESMVLNSNFVDSVEKKFNKDTIFVVGCRSGARSQKACEMLQQAGISAIYNIQGGFVGSESQQGWEALGLPVE